MSTFTPPTDAIVPTVYVGSGETGMDLPSHYRDVPPAMHRLMGRFRQGNRGRNVFLMADGSITETQPPQWDPSNPTGPVTQGWNPFTHSQDTSSLLSSQQVVKVFWGGCANPVSSAEATALTNAGYTVTA